MVILLKSVFASTVEDSAEEHRKFRKRQTSFRYHQKLKILKINQPTSIMY